MKERKPIREVPKYSNSSRQKIGQWFPETGMSREEGPLVFNGYGMGR